MYILRPLYLGVSIFIISTALIFCTSCGEPDSPEGPDLTDYQNSDESTDAGDDAEGDVDEVVECRQGYPLGDLSPGAEGSFELSLDSADGPSCLEGDEEERTQGSVAFKVQEPSLVEWTYITTAASEDIGSRSFADGCDDIEDSRCQIGRSAEFFYDGASDHLLHSEFADGSPSTPVHFRVESAACEDPGVGHCEEGQFHHCYQGRRVDTYPCAGDGDGDDDGCDDDRCAADTCSSALVVEPGDSTAPTIIDGHRQGYDHSGFFDNLQGCDLDNIDAESSDIFFAVHDIPEGQDLVVESRGQGSYGFFVVDGCEATSCLAGASMDESFENRLRWSPDQAQSSAIVAIRPSDPVRRAFSFALYFTPSG